MVNEALNIWNDFILNMGINIWNWLKIGLVVRFCYSHPQIFQWLFPFEILGYLLQRPTLRLWDTQVNKYHGNYGENPINRKHSWKRENSYWVEECDRDKDIGCPVDGLPQAHGFTFQRHGEYFRQNYPCNGPEAEGVRRDVHDQRQKCYVTHAQRELVVVAHVQVVGHAVFLVAEGVLVVVLGVVEAVGAGLPLMVAGDGVLVAGEYSQAQ